MRPPKTLHARALNILSRQETGRVNLEHKLAPHAESEGGPEKVLDEFAERNWQSSQRYAEAYICSRSNRYGTLRLKQALAQQGIDADDCRELLPGREDELQTAIPILCRRFRQEVEDLEEKQKQARFLTYRGLGADTIQTVLKTAWNKEEDSCR